MKKKKKSDWLFLFDYKIRAIYSNDIINPFFRRWKKSSLLLISLKLQLFDET